MSAASGLAARAGSPGAEDVLEEQEAARRALRARGAATALAGGAALTRPANPERVRQLSAEVGAG